jgi:uncharacterized membrane protein YphA (DoxX/SURF4 family)
VSAGRRTVLLVAGLAKVGVIAEFVRGVQALQLGPVSLRKFAAYAIPPLEVTVGALLLADAYVAQASYVALALFVVFALALLVALRNSPPASSCRCFGIRSSLGPRAIARRRLF